MHCPIHVTDFLLSHTFIREMQEEVFTKDPSSLPYILTPAFIASFTVTLLCPFVICPLLFPVLVPGYRSLGRRRNHFDTLLSSTLHAVVASSLTCYILMFGSLGTNRVFSKSSLGFTTLQISLGYFVADFFVCLKDPDLRKDIGSLLHHLAGIIGIGLGLYNQGLYAFFIIFRLISELSTPFVNLRWVFYELGPPYKDSLWYYVVSLGMVVSFFLCRILVLPWLWYQLLTTIVDPSSVIVPLVLRVWICINYTIFDVLNVYWFGKMIRGAVKVCRNWQKRASFPDTAHPSEARQKVQ